MRFLIFILSLAILLSCCSRESEYDHDAIRDAISLQMSKYPASTLKDIYKNFFQDAFGPGHLMSEADDARTFMANYLQRETEQAKTDPDLSPYYIKTGWRGNFYRVNLAVINDGLVPFETLLDALMESAGSFTLPQVEEWRKEWMEIEKIFRTCGYDVPNYQEDSKAIEDLLSRGEYASHHSERYEKVYHPHYRLIEKSIFEKRLLPLIEK